MDIQDILSHLCGECGQHEGVYRRETADGIDQVCRECRDSMIKTPSKTRLDAATHRALEEQKKRRKREVMLKRKKRKEEE